MKVLITGGCGFLGSNLAAYCIGKGYELSILDNLYRSGSDNNKKWLESLGEFNFFHADIRSYNDVETCILKSKPELIFHLAGQVAMTTSLNNPRLDFETNVLGGHNLLECVRKYIPDAIVTYSSTNKVYGDLEYIQYKETDTRYIAIGYENGFNESVKLDFQSPYGCSKGSVDQYMLDYAKMFGLKTVVFRHSSIFGTRQFSNFDQGWVGWFVNKYITAKQKGTSEPFTIAGSGKQVRDILFVDDLISCYFDAVASIDRTAGKAYNIGGGSHNSLSLLELFSLLHELTGVKLEWIQTDVRKSDQKVFIADFTNAKNDFNWSPSISKNDGVIKMIDWQKSFI